VHVETPLWHIEFNPHNKTPFLILDTIAKTRCLMLSQEIEQLQRSQAFTSFRRAGENKDNCSPPIRFYEPKVALNESDPEDQVSLKVKSNVDEPESRTNVSSSTFTKIKTFMPNGPLIAN